MKDGKMLILVYNGTNPYVNSTVKKISGVRQVRWSDTTEDIESFLPEFIICWDNPEVVRECVKFGVKCINITEKEGSEEDLILHAIVRPFDLQRVVSTKGNWTWSLSDLQETSRYLADQVKNFKPGVRRVINPGTVTSDEILRYWNLEPHEGMGEPQVSETDVKELSPIETHFQWKPPYSVNIYLPTYYRFKKTKACLESLLNQVKSSIHRVQVYIVDNNTRMPEMLEWLGQFAEKNQFHFLRRKENKGKGESVNFIHRNHSKKSDFIFSIDSDMVFPDDKNVIDDMIFHLTRIRDCGLVSSFQTGVNQHWWGRTIYPGARDGLEVGWTHDGIGVAGGCICMRSDDWNLLGGYRDGHDVYTGDDGILTHRVHRELGKEVLVAVKCKVHHPPPEEEEKGYQEWKMKSWSRDGLKFLDPGYKGENKKGYFD